MNPRNKRNCKPNISPSSVIARAVHSVWTDWTDREIIRHDTGIILGVSKKLKWLINYAMRPTACDARACAYASLPQLTLSQRCEVSPTKLPPIPLLGRGALLAAVNCIASDDPHGRGPSGAARGIGRPGDLQRGSTCSEAKAREHVKKSSFLRSYFRHTNS